MPHASPSRWIWIFPLTYAAHISEEVWASPGFPAWFSAQTGIHFTTRALVVSNAMGLAAMIIGIALVQRYARWRWVLTTLAAIVLLNGFMHVFASGATRSYSPGLITGVVVWIPLGGITLMHEWRHAARSTFVKGLIAAAVFHVLLVAAFLAG